jgi:5-methylcytosine-specific restriction endonuclease McrA
MAKIPVNASCHLCGSRDRLHRHHIDWNHHNNTPSNLTLVCQACHVMLHKVGYLDREELDAVRAAAMARDPTRFDSPVASGSQAGLFKW